MLCVIVGLTALIVGIVIGAVYRAKIQADVLTRAGDLYREIMLERNAAITVLSKVKEELAQIQGNGHKRVVLASDLTSIRKIAQMPEETRVEKRIVGG